MANPRTTLTKGQISVIEAMVVQGMTMADAGRTHNIAVSTIRNWKHTPLWAEAYKAAQVEYEDNVWRRIRAAASDAAQTLIDVAQNVGEKGAVRIMAAGQILDRAGYKTLDKSVEMNPATYTTREELVAALAAIPKDVLVEALAKMNEYGGQSFGTKAGPI